MTRSSWEAALAGLAEPDREVAQLLLSAADLDHDGRLSFQGRASTGSSPVRPLEAPSTPVGPGRGEERAGADSDLPSRGDPSRNEPGCRRAERSRPAPASALGPGEGGVTRMGASLTRWAQWWPVPRDRRGLQSGR